MFEFKEITIEDKELIDSYIINKKENSEMSFVNLYIWKDYYQSRYCICDGMMVFIHTVPDGKRVCSYPCGRGDVLSCLTKLKEYFAQTGEALVITNATRKEADDFKRFFPCATVTENRDFEDYVYSTDSLISLSGKKLHAKRNHLNRFKNTYKGYVYRPITEDDFSRCIGFAKFISGNLDYSGEISDSGEIRSIELIFEKFHQLGLKGGLIEIEGNLAAFTVCEEHIPGGAIIHVEKADTAYDGIYVAINNEFASNELSHTEFINREEDMGLEGLRKAKLSYRPCRMVEKFICIAK